MKKFVGAMLAVGVMVGMIGCGETEETASPTPTATPATTAAAEQG